MTKIIRNKIILTAILFITIFTVSAYSVERKYIPNTAEAIFSFNLESLSKKADSDLQQIFNSAFMQRLADSFLESRDDEKVAEIMTNRLAQLFDFSKDSKIIFLNDYGQLAVIIDILNIEELDKLMIKIASQEDKLISFSETVNYRYLRLDENTLISWNNEVFTVSLRGLFFEDNDNIIYSAENIFKGNELENEYFISLENETNDFYAWVDLSFLSEEDSSLYKLLLELSGDIPNNVKDIYKDGVLTGKINFNDGEADMVFDTHLPNNDYDISSLKKVLSENIFNFVNGQNNYGFLSFSFDSLALAKIMENIDFGSIFNYEISSQLEKLGVNSSTFFELLGGDIFASAWDTPEETTAVLFSISLKDEAKVKNILEALAEEREDDIYIIEGDYYYIKDSILYIVNEETVINSIVKGEIPSSKLDEDKLKLAKENMFSFYFEFDIANLGLLFGLDALEDFKSIYLTSNILDNNHTQTVIKWEIKDKTKNFLTVIKSLIEN